MSNFVRVHNMAVAIFDALNKKGAGLGSASIFIIEKAIEVAQSAQRTVGKSDMDDLYPDAEQSNAPATRR